MPTRKKTEQDPSATFSNHCPKKTAQNYWRSSRKSKNTVWPKSYGFTKKTQKTPRSEIRKADNIYKLYKKEG